MLAMANTCEQIDYGVVQHVSRIIDTCIEALVEMNRAGEVRHAQVQRDVGRLYEPADCISVADLICICYEFLGLVAVESIGRKELMKFGSNKIFTQLL